jgi:hypothetical protein
MELKKAMRALFGVLIVGLVLCVDVASTRFPSSAAAVPHTTVVLTQSRISMPAGVTNLWWQLVPSPDDPDKLVVCELQTDTSRDSWVQGLLYGSDDAGETWRTLKTTNDLPNNSEASCALGSHDRAYFTVSMGAQLPKELRIEQSRMDFWSSSDFGKSWHPGPHLPYTDAAILQAVPGGAHDDRVFDLYTISGGAKQVTGRLLNVFDSDGTHTQSVMGWPKSRCGAGLSGAPLPGTHHSLNDLPPGTALLPARSSDCTTRVLMQGTTLLDDHTVGVTHMEWSFVPERARLTFSRVSTDGKTMSNPVVIASYMPDVTKWLQAHAGPYENNGDDSSLASGPVPDSSGNRIYVAWHDPVGGRLRILLASSSDGGATWTAPHAIDDAALRGAGPVRALPSGPSVAVNAQGIVAVKWSEHSGNCWRVALSRDGGEHFEPSFPLNPCNPKAKLSLEEQIAGHINAISVGHLAFDHADAQSEVVVENMRQIGATTRGMSIAAAQDGSFYALWAQQYALNSELHITHITLPGYTSLRTQHRQDALAKATCCYAGAGGLGLDYTSVDYDPATQEFTIGATLVVRRQDVTWPLVVRTTDVTSRLGTLVASNSDNAIGGVGAAWVFDGPGTEPLPSSVAAADFKMLPAGEYAFSKPRTMRFRLSKPDQPMPAWRGRDDQAIWVNVKTEVLTQPVAGAESSK